MPDNLQISFIVPIFNAEKTLERCVKSLLYQGLDSGSYEIILVNDGSTDSSLAICNDLALSYSCISIVSQENAGLSSARNRGISSSCGEYLCFVDADDFLFSKRLASVVPYCAKGADIIRYWCVLVDSKTKTEIVQDDGAVIFRGKGKEYLRKFGLETFCWNYLYKRSFIDSHQLRFRPNIVMEDFPFMFDVMMANPDIISLSWRVYGYSIHTGSLSRERSPNHSRKIVKDMLSTLSEISYRMSEYQSEDNQLFLRCRQSLEEKTIAMFSRVLSSEYTIGEFLDLVSSCRKNKLLPLRSGSYGIKDWFFRKAINMLTMCPIIYPLVCYFYKKIFLPYVYPQIDKNG